MKVGDRVKHSADYCLFSECCCRQHTGTIWWHSPYGRPIVRWDGRPPEAEAPYDPLSLVRLSPLEQLAGVAE